MYKKFFFGFGGQASTDVSASGSVTLSGGGQVTLAGAKASTSGILYSYYPGDAVDTFSRASVATYQQKDGTLATASSGEIRDAHYVGTLEDGRFRPLDQLEVWTDVECSSGSRLSVLPNVFSVEERWELGQRGRLGREELIAQMPFDQLKGVSGSTQVVREGRVLRVEEGDGTTREWRIVEVERRRRDSGETAMVKCESIARDLYRRTPLIQRIESGRADLDFNILGLTPTEWIDEIILPTDEFPDWVTRGTVESSDAVSLMVDLEPAGPLMDKIAEVTAHEWELRRDGSTGYKLDLVFQRGSTHKPYVALKRNLLSAKHRTSAKEQATRVYPLGSGRQGQRATMADHRWKVSAVSTGGRTATLADPSGEGGPIAFDDQLGGSTAITQDYWLEKPDETRLKITDSTTGQVVTLSTDATLPSTGDLVTIRGSSSGDELTYLEDPAKRGTYGLQVRTLDRQDVPPVQNLLSDVASAYLNQWGEGSTSLPNGWEVVGSSSNITVTKETGTGFWRHGRAAAKCVTQGKGVGLQTSEITVGPTELSPHFVAQLVARASTGTVYQVHLVDVTNGTLIPTTNVDAAKNSAAGVLTRHGINPGKINFADQGTTAMRVRVVSRTTDATFYVDSAQLTRRQNNPRHMWQSRGANDLWRAANDELSDRSDPEDTFDVEATDLYRSNIDLYPDDRIDLGTSIIANDPGLDFDVDLRVVSITRELTTADKMKIKVDQRPRTLADRLRERMLDTLELADEVPPDSGSEQTEGQEITSLRGKIGRDWIEANTITANEIDAGTITATELNVSELSEISNDAGIIVSGKLQGSSTNRFLDLDASSTNPFLRHDATKLLANGDAVFSGEVASQEFTAGDMRVLNLLRVGDDVSGIADNRVELVGQTGVSNEMSLRILSNILGSPTEKIAIVGDGGNSNPSIRWQSARPLQLDDGSANTSEIAGVVVSGSTPSGDFPDGTIWVQTT